VSAGVVSALTLEKHHLIADNLRHF